MDHCFVRLSQNFPRGIKADVATLEALNTAFRQNFDNISPWHIMIADVGLAQHCAGRAGIKWRTATRRLPLGPLGMPHLKNNEVVFTWHKP
jgi:hypothetical protein